MGITKDDDTPPNINPPKRDKRNENPPTQKPNPQRITAMINDEITKLKIVITKLSENSRINDGKLILNAPSNNKNTKVKVVKTGANETKSEGEIIFKTKGPIINPNAIKNKTSGTLNFLKNHSAKNPKNRIRLNANKINDTTSITLE